MGLVDKHNKLVVQLREELEAFILLISALEREGCPEPVFLLELKVEWDTRPVSVSMRNGKYHVSLFRFRQTNVIFETTDVEEAVKKVLQILREPSASVVPISLSADVLHGPKD